MPILRNISEENLDPKVNYVAGKNGKLVPKKSKTLASKVKEDKKVVLEEVAVEEVEVLPVVDSSSSEEKESVEASVETSTPKKKSTFKKKKTEATDE